MSCNFACMSVSYFTSSISNLFPDLYEDSERTGASAREAQLDELAAGGRYVISDGLFGKFAFGRKELLFYDSMYFLEY